MGDTSHEQGHPTPEADRALRVLRRLVTVLTATMIVGLLVLIALFVTRFPRTGAAVALPPTLVLPGGGTATAYTQGDGWFAVVADGARIHVYDATSGALRQSVEILGHD